MSRSATARALVCAFVLCGLCSLGQLSVVSTDWAGQPGQGHSGYQESRNWGRALVADDGTVVFLSEAGDLSDNLSVPDSDTDWDVFSRTVGGQVEPVSVAFFDFGQAMGLAAAGGRCIEVREDDTPPTRELLLWRSLSGAEDPTQLASASTAFRQLRLADGGAFVVFLADDNAGAPGDTEGRLDVFLYALPASSGATPVRISSRAHAAGDRHLLRDCEHPDVSDTGERVAFSSSDSGVVASDTNDSADVFLWQGGALTRVNQRHADQNDGLGTQTSHPCEQPVISGDGTMVFYVSEDAHIVSGDSNAVTDVFGCNLAAGTAERVSVTADGEQTAGPSDSPDCSSDARFVTYRSTASNLPGARNGIWQVYVLDRTSGYVECVSVAADGQGAESDCYAPAISPNGRYITFCSSADNLVGSTTSNLQVFRYDRGAHHANVPPVVADVAVSCPTNDVGETNECQIALAGTDSDGPAALSYRIEALPDGSEGVITDSSHSAIAAGESVVPARLPLIFRPAEGYAGAVVLAYNAYDGAQWSRSARLSIAVTDRLALVSADANGDPGNGHSPPAISVGQVTLPTFGSELGMSGDARWVVFATEAQSLSGVGQGGVVLRDRQTSNTYTLATFFAAGEGGLSFPVMGLNGTAVAYVLENYRLRWHRVDPASPPGLTADRERVIANELDLRNLSLSGDGTRVVFQSVENPIQGTDGDGEADVYLWEPESDTLALVSQGHQGAPTDHGCVVPAISADGRCVVFGTRGSLKEGVAASTNHSIWIKYLDTGTCAKVVETSGTVSDMSLSRFGRYVCCAVGTTTTVYDVTKPEGQRELLTIAGTRSPRLSADGRFVSFGSNRTDLSPLSDGVSNPASDTLRQLYRYDRSSGVYSPLSHDGSSYGDNNSHNGPLSLDGRYAAFSTDAVGFPGDGSAFRDIFVADLGEAFNAAPVCQGSNVVMDTETSLNVQLTGSDADGSDLAFEIVTAPGHGSLSSISYPGVGGGHASVVYTLTESWAGTDTFTFRALDAAAESTPVTVTVEIREVEAVLALAEGWNAFSLPMVPEQNGDPAVILSDGGRGVVYEGAIWTWLNGRWRAVDQLTAGQGYLLRCPAGVGPVTVRGLPVVESVRALAPGWSFIGPVGYTGTVTVQADVQGNALDSSRLVQRSGGVYQQVNGGVLSKAGAYWLYAGEGQSFDLGLRP